MWQSSSRPCQSTFPTLHDTLDVPESMCHVLVGLCIRNSCTVTFSTVVQLFIIPIFFTFGAFIGIVVTSAGNILYGSYIWDPLRLIDKWDNRAAAFFASFSFALATLGTNISANSISAANDFTAMAPKVRCDYYSC